MKIHTPYHCRLLVQRPRRLGGLLAALGLALHAWVAAAQTPAQFAPSAAASASTTSSAVTPQAFEQRLRYVQTLVARLSAEPSTPAKRDLWTQALRQQLSDLGAQADNVRSDLPSPQSVLASRGLWGPQSQSRQTQLQAQIASRSADFARRAQAWLAQPAPQTLADLSAFFAQTPTPQTAQRLALAWGGRTGTPREPAQTPGQWQQRMHPVDASAAALQAQRQLQTQNPVPGLRFSTAPAAHEAPQEADLAEQGQVVLSADIRAKAAELGHNPVTIGNWVRNTIEYIPTWGATQDAQSTLTTLRGNALDTASLHIALLRAASIPARYQFGTIELPTPAALNWLGGLSHAQGALDLLQQGGIAASGVSQAGQISAIRMEHVWVHAYVNWSPSRGAKSGGADLNPAQHPNPNALLNAWVPMDAAYKSYRHDSGLNLAELAPGSAAAWLGSVKQGAVCTPASASALQLPALASRYSDFKSQAGAQLSALGADAQVGQILGQSSIEQRHPSMLAGSLPYTVVAAADPSATAAAALNWTVQIQLRTGNDTVLQLSRPLADLQGQSLVLSFAPETAADAATLAQLLRSQGSADAGALPASIAAYLVRLKAQLRLNGALVGEGGSYTLGQNLTLQSLLTSPHGAQQGGEHLIIAGETHAWAIQGQTLAPSTVAQSALRLMQLRDAWQGGAAPHAGEAAAQVLQSVAATYQAHLDAKARLYQSASGVRDVRLPSLVRASTRLEVQTDYGVVTHVRAAGTGLHVDHYASAMAPRSASSSAQAYPQQSLQRASASAHQLLQRLWGPAGSPAQSALSALAAAAANGQTVLRADSATLADALDQLDANSNLRTPLQDAVANGQQALLSPSAVDLGGLPMEPLVLIDPASGAASYSITSVNPPPVQLTAQRTGLSGWLGLADEPATKALLAPVLQASLEQLNTAQSLLNSWAGVRWGGFAGQAELIDGLYQSRISEAAQTSNACDWLIATLAGQLSSGLPGTAQLNRPPLITSQPVTSARADQAYSYAVLASDPDGDLLRYSIRGAPSGMSISNVGLIQWPRPVAGEFTLQVQVNDGQATTDQIYLLRVGDAMAPLQLQAQLEPAVASPGQSVALTTRLGGGAPGLGASISATLDGAALSLDASGSATLLAPPAGTHRIVVSARVGEQSVSRELILTVRDSADATAPLAQITSPQADASLRGVVTITGSATDARFAYYQLLLRPVGAADTEWQVLSQGLSPVANAALGQLDTTTLANGLHQLALRVVDVNGAQTLASLTVDIAGNLKLGQFKLSFADVRAEAPGLPLMLTRTYDSAQRQTQGDFGYGWAASAQDLSVRKNMNLGLDWQVSTRQFQLCLQPVGKRRISITLPGGGLYRFDAQNNPECSAGQVPQPNIDFQPVPGPTGGSVAGRSSGGGQLRAIDGALVLAQGGKLVDADSGEPWNPKDFELTTEEGFKYALREGVGILYVTDPYGNRVSYGASGYQHSAGLSVSLTRDAQGRITQASDPQGQSLSYAYNARGELQSVTDRTGAVTRFTYATDPAQPHLLQSITDPRGVVVMSNQFDELGRLTSSADALGQASTQQFELASNQQTVTDRRGNPTVYSFDTEGNITQVTNALGQTSRYTFDANGNELSSTNALGQTITRTFDANGKQTSETNPLGHTTRTTYASVGTPWQRLNPLSSTDARGNSTAYGYDGSEAQQPGATPNAINEPLDRTTAIDVQRGNLRSLNIAGELLSYDYDSLGRRTKETNALGQETRYTFDANGNELSRTVIKTTNGNPQSLTTTSTFDAENRMVAETDPLGATRTMVYNSAGKLTSQTNALEQRTTYTYDANARLTSASYPDGSSESTTYDAEGNETAKTDRAGRTTRMEFDALNRLVKTTYPDGSTETSTYDAAGRVTATTDRKGQASSMEYDAAGRQTAAVDATGIRTSQTFDENANRTSTTTAGRTTTFTYDALNRLTLTQYPDGSSHSTVYRPDNRKQSETDARGLTTTYGYDAAGRLTSVTQNLTAGASPTSATTAYSYDETGAKTSQLDALGRTTTWSLDAGGRITSRKIQDGTTESNSYDLEGKRLSHTSFAGETLTYQYDAQGQLTAMVVPAGSGTNSTVPQGTVIFGYTPSGQIQSQQEQGATTLSGTQSYRYDANDRLVQSTSPLGQLSYTLDATGNPTERSASNASSDAGTASSEYDAAGRLIKVTAPDGKQTRYQYDGAGRLIQTESELNAAAGQPQVLRTHHAYDSADRLVAIAHLKHAGAVQTLLAGQVLSRNAGGAIERIQTYRAGFGTASFDAPSAAFSGTPASTQSFEYDANSRLTRQSRVDAQTPALSLDTRYTYDAVGNRTAKSASSAAGTEVTRYSYDSADRLTQEQVALAAGGGRTTTYTRDQNGNLSAKLEPGQATLYRFDPQSRLIDIRAGATQAEATAATPSITYAYDASGNRIRKTLKTGMSPDRTDVSSYLIDSSHSYPQVALETTASSGSSTGTQSTAYVWGVQLIRQTRGGAGTLFASADAANDLFPLQGHLNTSLGALDADGNLVEQSQGDAFGQLDAPTGLKQGHLFAGEYWDQDAQLLYLRARWYDPRIGRFISADPFEGKQTNPRSLNRYVYAASDPAHSSDPTGQTTAGEMGAAGSVGGTLTSIALPRVGIYLAAARSTHLAVASVPFMAGQGSRITQFVQGSGRAGWNALQTSVHMVARGASATQQQIQNAWTVGSSYTGTLNEIIGIRASSLGLEVHKLLEASLRLPANVTYSLANMAPTPITVHRAISVIHSTKDVLFRGQTLRESLRILTSPPNPQLTVEQVYLLEARIWAAAMQGQQLTPQLVQALRAAL